MDDPTAARPATRFRRGVLAGAAAVVLVGLVVVTVGVIRGPGQGSTPPPAAAATPTSASGAPQPSAPREAPPTDPSGPPAVSPRPAGPTSDANELPPELPAVGLQERAETDGVTVELSAVEGIAGRGTGPGNVAGPAVRVTVRLHNGSAEALDLFGVAVGVTYGDDRRPGPPLDDPSTAPFAGTLEPGGSAEGVYAFRVPEDVRDVVTVSVGYRPGAPYLVFTGAVR